jgi:ferric-dicitrate binding protein FerR (iron transport regulator)
MSGFTDVMAVRGMGANIGAAMEKSLLAWYAADEDAAIAWERIAQDLTHLGRGMARETWTQEAINAEHSAIMDRWDALIVA